MHNDLRQINQKIFVMIQFFIINNNVILQDTKLLKLSLIRFLKIIFINYNISIYHTNEIYQKLSQHFYHHYPIYYFFILFLFNILNKFLYFNIKLLKIIKILKNVFLLIDKCNNMSSSKISRILKYISSRTILIKTISSRMTS